MSSVDRKTYMAKLRLNEMLADHDVSLPADLYDEIVAALREQPEALGVVETNKTRITLHQDRAGCEWITVTNADYPDFESEVTPDDDPALFAFLKDLTAAQQPVQEGGGVCPKCRGTGEVCTGYIDGTPEMFDCTCRAAAPPSAPVGVEDKARAMFEAQADNLAAPWDRQWEPTKDFWRKCAAEALTQQPAQAAPGERIMVNAAHDVYTLPLEPSGLRSGARFVVHVPTAEASADVDAWVKQKLPKSYHALPLVEILELLFTAGVAAEQEIIAAAPTPPGDDAAGGGQ